MKCNKTPLYTFISLILVGLVSTLVLPSFLCSATLTSYWVPQTIESEKIDHYEVQIDGGLWLKVLPQIDAHTFTARLCYELPDLEIGEHTISVKAINIFKKESPITTITVTVSEPQPVKDANVSQ